MKKETRLVYTSDPEEAKRLREAAVGGAPATDAPPQQQNIRVTLDRKRRAGKSVTVASGFELSAPTLEKLAGALKKRCGAGGTAKEREVEIQGDHVDTVMAELARLGYKVKRSGG